MIYSVKGELIHFEENLAVVECAGVGFSVRTASSSLNGLKTGETVVFYTYMIVREDAIELFGFTGVHELNCFKMLLSVSGVGPKAALSILSFMSPQGFALAVVSDDVKALTKVPGIGAKTAQLIILKLKDKLAKQMPVSADSAKSAGISKQAGGNLGGDALNALLVLGFSASEAAGALSGLSEDMETSEKIKQALKKLASRK